MVLATAPDVSVTVTVVWQVSAPHSLVQISVMTLSPSTGVKQTVSPESVPPITVAVPLAHPNPGRAYSKSPKSSTPYRVRHAMPADRQYLSA